MHTKDGMDLVSVYSCQQESYPKIGWKFESPENLSKKRSKHSFILVLVQSGKYFIHVLEYHLSLVSN